MKNLLIYSSAFLLLLLASCSTAGNRLPKAQVTSLLSGGEFTFMAERANPTNNDVVNVMNSLPGSGSSRILNLDYGYTLQLHQSELKVELPFFGRAYSAQYGSSDNSFRFTSKDFTVDQSAGKYGSTIYNIAPQDHNQVQKIVMEVYGDGTAWVSINSRDRQPISYHGYIMANPLKTESQIK